MKKYENTVDASIVLSIFDKLKQPMLGALITVSLLGFRSTSNSDVQAALPHAELDSRLTSTGKIVYQVDLALNAGANPFDALEATLRLNDAFPPADRLPGADVAFLVRCATRAREGERIRKD